LLLLAACAQVTQNSELESEGITKTFYVATTGNDASPGTLAQPFRTIQKCAAIATPGTACSIRAGTYRETVKPTNSGTSGLPILFQPYNNETVLVSGADLVKNWTVESGSIYKAPIAWTLEAGSNQVFVDGKMMTEARYPNTSPDLFAPWGKFVNPTGSDVTYTVEAARVPANLTGANINFVPGPEWVVETGKITAVTNSSFTFTSPGGQLAEPVSWNPSLYVPRPGNPYFIWGKRVLLDTAHEWFLGNGQLSLWTPQGDNPNNRTVEVKRREFAFDLTDRAYITVTGVHIFAATITTADLSKSPDEATARNILLKGIHVRYPSHFTNVLPGTGWSEGMNNSGIILFGQNHSLQNSTIAFSAGNGVTLAGSNHKVSNNIIHDVNYTVTDTNAVNTGFYGYTSKGHLIQNNTLYNTGRSSIVHRKTQGLKILNNHMYNGGLLGNDLGLTYTYDTDGGGTEIAYNIVHDNFASSESMGIYLDNFSSNFVVHHNIVYNVRYALNLNLPSKNNKIYNNTLVGFNESVGSGASEVADCDATGTELINNIFTAETNLGGVFDGTACPVGQGLPTFTNNVEQTINPTFVDTIAPNFALASGSPAINKGQILSPYTNGYSGSAPDIGALESGLTAFKAGAPIKEPCIYGDSCTTKPTLRYGVSAEYFRDETLTTLEGKRVEGTLNFGYYNETHIPTGSFLPSGKNYSARWTSYLKAPVTSTYTFTLTADDGARLWLNNVQRINRWDYVDPPTNSFSVNLQAGQYYPLKIEMHQNAGGAAAILEWSYSGQPTQIIPTRYLTLNKP
ncbi:MAG: PA14 domain-containing protein, partial [Trueperaceae bacterium]